MNVRSELPEPLAYVSVTSRGDATEPALTCSVGVPVTLTPSENCTLTGMTAPSRYVPSTAVEVMPVTVGAVVSICQVSVSLPLPVGLMTAVE